MNKNKENLDAIIQKELYAEFDRIALENYVRRHLRERGYCVFHARNANKRFTCFIDKSEGRNVPGSFHAAYLGIVIELLQANGFHIERIIVPGTDPQIGECDIYVTLSGMVEPTRLHRRYSSAEPPAVGEATNPLHIITRAANPIPINMQRIDVNAEVSNKHNDPLMLTQTDTISLRWVIVFAVICSAFVALIYFALLQDLFQ